MVYDDFLTNFEISRKYQSLRQGIQFWLNWSDLRPDIPSLFDKFDQKVKGLAHGFWQIFDQFQTFEISRKCV